MRLQKQTSLSDFTDVLGEGGVGEMGEGGVGEMGEGGVGEMGEMGEAELSPGVSQLWRRGWKLFSLAASIETSSLTRMP
jgi:hypothetical protein